MSEIPIIPMGGKKARERDRCIEVTSDPNIFFYG